MLRTAKTAAACCWPDARQRLLIGAAVWNDERALRAWNRWRALVTRDEVTAVEARLLATAFRPLRRLGADDPMLTLAAGAYRQTWYSNQLALRRTATAIERLYDAGIEVIALKGVALSLLHYRNLGARPMGDIDLLVGPHRVDDAVAALHPGGWEVVGTQVSGPLRFETHVVDTEGHELDLHEYALMQPADDSDLWQTRVPLQFMGTQTSALAPAEQLLHVCAHGLRWDETPTIRWAADAAVILTSAGRALDWERVVERAQARRLTVAVGQALAWLRESLEADVPRWALTRLHAGPRLRFERVVHRLSMRQPTPLAFAVLSFDRYRRLAKLAPAEEHPGSFARYLKSAWELSSGAQLLVHGGRKLAGKTR
jgi:Uncharacterised nucleotidyltransferase